jgi:CDP-glucose 4,6-dehydratase
MKFSGGWNFGPADEDSRPVSRVVELLAVPWGVQSPWVRDTVAHPHEAVELRLNSQKAKSLLGWQGRLPLATTLAWTSDWFRRYATGEAVRNLCFSQIDDYTAVKLEA